MFYTKLSTADTKSKISSNEELCDYWAKPSELNNSKLLEKNIS